MGSLECREKTQLPSQWNSVSLKKEREGASLWEILAWLLLWCWMLACFISQNVASTDTETLHCSCVKLWTCTFAWKRPSPGGFAHKTHKELPKAHVSTNTASLTTWRLSVTRLVPYLLPLSVGLSTYECLCVFVFVCLFVWTCLMNFPITVLAIRLVLI